MFDDEHMRSPKRGLVNSAKDLNALLIVPVVKNQLQHVGVCTRNCDEHVSTDISASIAYAKLIGPEQCLVPDYIRPLEHHTSQVRVLHEKTAEHVALAA